MQPFPKIGFRRKGKYIKWALFTTLNGYTEMLQSTAHLGQFGRLFPLWFLFTAFALWFFGLPCVICLIDMKQNPKRIERLAETIPQYYDSSI